MCNFDPHKHIKSHKVLLLYLKFSWRKTCSFHTHLKNQHRIVVSWDVFKWSVGLVSIFFFFSFFYQLTKLTLHRHFPSSTLFDVKARCVRWCSHDAFNIVSDSERTDFWNKQFNKTGFMIPKVPWYKEENTIFVVAPKSDNDRALTHTQKCY